MPSLKQIGLSVEGPEGSALEHTSAILRPDLVAPIHGERQPGTRHFLFRYLSTVTGGAYLNVSAPGFKAQDIRLPRPLQELIGELPVVTLRPTALPRLRADGRWFVREDGTREVVKLHTDFKLYKLWMEGNRDPLMQETIDAGSGGPRVFLTCKFLFDLDPRAYGVQAFLDQLGPFSDYLAAKGRRWEATIGADIQMFAGGFDFPSFAEQAVEALSGKTNVLCEYGNEIWKNGIDPATWRHVPNGIPQSIGSFGDGMGPYRATMPENCYLTFHPQRSYKWPVTSGVTAWELRNYPGGALTLLINEPIGAAEQDEPDRRATNAEWFEMMGTDCGTFTGGMVFHSAAKLRSEPWGPTQRACAEAAFAGLRRCD